MDALMKAVSRDHSRRVEWSGMEIAAVTKPTVQDTLLPDIPQQVETEVDIFQIEVGGATQLSWSGLEVAPVTKPPRLRVSEEQIKSKVTEVKVKGGGVQLSFL